MSDTDALLNDHGQPIGRSVPGWSARALPPATAMTGRLCRVERIDGTRHADQLWSSYEAATDDRGWTYLPYERARSREEFRGWLDDMQARSDPMLHVVVEASADRAVGVAAFMRMDPANGVIEVGHLNYSPLLQRSAVATEVMYLMARRAFDELGYRRYEWKCDALNEPSRRAAQRLGFRFEGVFRNAVVYKGRNRDTAWFSITDTEWPSVRSGFERWLSRDNFEQGRQLATLEACRASAPHPASGC